ncbi:hypothetical protein [uncultured Jatrophihabitans sp.]|uniref:hypothetical protein n=1 Tax=uncultured Jatrophihabitans sp. TaxID=1610747 RepID=UPI0035CAC622
MAVVKAALRSWTVWLAVVAVAGVLVNVASVEVSAGRRHHAVFRLAGQGTVRIVEYRHNLDGKAETRIVARIALPWTVARDFASATADFGFSARSYSHLTAVPLSCELVVDGRLVWHDSVFARDAQVACYASAL